MPKQTQPKADKSKVIGSVFSQRIKPGKDEPKVVAMRVNNNRNNTRFLRKQKPKLKNRLNDHLKLREKEIKQILDKTINHMKDLGYTIEIILADYNNNQSFINMDEINALIDNWKGLQIKKRVITQGKYHSKSVNWLDQNSRKVSGPFFCKHFTAIKKYLMKYCENINVSKTKQKHILNYSCVYLALEILSATVNGFTRCKPQPLIRCTTLAKSKDVYNGFQSLCNINLCKLVKIVKSNTKFNNPKKKQIRIDCKVFSHNLLQYCNDLLKQQKQLLLNENCDITNDIIPAYFKDSQVSVSEVSQQTEQSTTDENSISDDFTQHNLPPVVSCDDLISNDILSTSSIDCKCDYEPPPIIPSRYYNSYNNGYYPQQQNYWYPQYSNYNYNYPPQMYQSTGYQSSYYSNHSGYELTGEYRWNPMELQPIPIQRTLSYPQNNIFINHNLSMSQALPSEYNIDIGTPFFV